jgi:CRP-like cAMP-binding protein
VISQIESFHDMGESLNKTSLEQIIDFFEKSGFNAMDALTIAQHFSPRTFKKGELLLEIGNINRHLGFVESGNFMFYVLANGEEKTTYIVGKNEFVASLKSFLKEVPSREYIRSINESKVWFITKSDLDKLLLEINGFQRFYIQVLGSAFIIMFC